MLRSLSRKLGFEFVHPTEILICKVNNRKPSEIFSPYDKRADVLIGVEMVFKMIQGNKL